VERFQLSNPSNAGIILSANEVKAIKEIVYVFKQLNEAHQTTDSAAYKLAKELSEL
jgi:hypothetical protein